MCADSASEDVYRLGYPEQEGLLKEADDTFMSYISTIHLKQLELLHRSVVGGKAASLGRLYQLFTSGDEIYVPDGFCWTSTASMEVISPVYSHFAEVVRRTDLENDVLISLSEEMQARILACEFPLSLQEELQAQCGLLALEQGVAVRSSGIEEDGDSASFAGQHDTYLGVDSNAAVVDAIRCCIASGYSYSTMRYRQRHGFSLLGMPMPLVIQQLVDARSAGVILTRDPRGEGDTAWLEAVWGLGELLVSGEAIPDSFSISLKKGKVINSRVVRKLQERVYSDGRIQNHVIEPERSTCSALSLEEVERIVQVGSRLERVFGYPLEIEWAIDQNGRVALLQARPLKFTALNQKRNCAE